MTIDKKIQFLTTSERFSLFEYLVGHSDSLPSKILASIAAECLAYKLEKGHLPEELNPETFNLLD